jgi:hypothetical protein
MAEQAVQPPRRYTFEAVMDQGDQPQQADKHAQPDDVPSLSRLLELKKILHSRFNQSSRLVSIITQAVDQEKEKRNSPDRRCVEARVVPAAGGTGVLQPKESGGLLTISVSDYNFSPCNQGVVRRQAHLLA